MDPSTTAPIVLERNRRKKELRFVQHACDFTRERLLLVLKTAKGRGVLAEEVGTLFLDTEHDVFLQCRCLVA